MKDRLKRFLSEAVSKDERYVSILIVFAFMFTVLAVFTILKNGDIPVNLLTLLTWLYGFIAANSSVEGVADKFKGFLNKKKEGEE